MEIEPIVENTNTLETLSPAEEVIVRPAMPDVLSNSNSELKQSEQRLTSIAIEIYASEPKIILTDINDTVDKLPYCSPGHPCHQALKQSAKDGSLVILNPLLKKFSPMEKIHTYVYPNNFFSGNGSNKPWFRVLFQIVAKILSKMSIVNQIPFESRAIN